MDKATKALKRGSIRFKAHGDLNIIISDLNDIRSTEKASIKAYQIFIEDLVKWSHQDKNEALKYLFSLLTDLNMLWTGVHFEFLENLKNCKYQFDMILENEQCVDKAKENLAHCEQYQTKLNRELKKKKKAQPENLDELGDKVKDAERAVDLAKSEVTEKVSESEIIKLIRLKNGLMKLTEACLTLSNKCNTILAAQKDVVSEIPDFSGNQLQDLKYSVLVENGKAKEAVYHAKEIIQAYTNIPLNIDALSPLEYESPPPYSPFLNQTSTSSSCSSDFVPSAPFNTESSSSFARCSSLLRHAHFHRRSNSMNIPSISRASSINGYSLDENHLLDNSVIQCNPTPFTYICCKCSSKLVTTHMYRKTKGKSPTVTGITEGVSDMHIR